MNLRGMVAIFWAAQKSCASLNKHRKWICWGPVSAFRYWRTDSGRCRIRSEVGHSATSPRSELPIAAMYPLFDHLVGAREQVWRHLEVKGFGSLQVDHQIVLGGCLYRQVPRFLAPEDAIDVAGRSPIRLDRIRPVGDQTAAGGEVAKGIDRRESVLGRQRDDQVAMNRRQRAGGYEQAAVRSGCECRDRALDLVRVAHNGRAQFHP